MGHKYVPCLWLAKPLGFSGARRRCDNFHKSRLTASVALPTVGGHQELFHLSGVEVQWCSCCAARFTPSRRATSIAIDHNSSEIVVLRERDSLHAQIAMAVDQWIACGNAIT